MRKKLKYWNVDYGISKSLKNVHKIGIIYLKHLGAEKNIKKIDPHISCQ